MKKLLLLLILAVEAWATAYLQGANPPPAKTSAPADKPAPKHSGPQDAPPAKRKPLLLLDDEPEPEEAETPLLADNSRCHVCHVNYEKEELAVVHARANIGCAKCHGASDAHIADESWASGGKGTPPDKMFARDKVNPSCLTCHAMTAADADQDECTYPTMKPKKTCTDCHGKHRLANRKCKWK